MNFRDNIAPQLSTTEGNAFAKSLPLRHFTLDASGLQKLHRLKEIVEFHPNIVNPELSPEDKSYYYQALYDCLDAIAIVLDDITGEKDVDPFVVETFGDPAHRPPIRLSPTHRKFVRDEF